MTTPPGKTELVFRMEAPSSPARVAAVALMLDAMIRAVAPDLKDEELTMVVSNFLSKSEIRPRSPEAHRAVQLVMRFLENPIRTAKKHPETRGVAKVLRDKGAEFSGMSAQFTAPRKRKPPVDLNDDYLRSMAAVAKGAVPGTQKALVWQGLQILSPVLRAGRLHDSWRHHHARVVIDDAECELSVSPDAVGAAHDAAKNDDVYIVDIDAAYERASDGRLILDPTSSVLTNIAPAPRALGGAALLSFLAEHAPSLRHGDISDLATED